MNNPLARHLAARFQETVTSHQEIYQDDPKLQIILYIAHTNQEKAVAEKMADKQEAAAAAYAEKRVKVKAAVNKALVDRDKAEKAEFQRMVNLSRQIDRAEKLVKLKREIRITSKYRKWKYFLKKLKSKSGRKILMLLKMPTQNFLMWK